MKNVKMRLMAIILCISFVVSGIGPMPTSLAAEAPFQSGSAQKNNQSNLFNEEFVKTNLAQADSVQSDSVQPDSVQPNSEQKNAGDEIQTGTEGKVSEPSNLINITTDISSGLSAEEDDASSTPAPAGPPLTDSEEDLKNSASVQQATVQLQAETITTGITLEAMTKYTGVKTRVTRGELPAALQGFSKIMVACSAVPYNVAESGLPQWISSAYKGTYDDNYYISSVSQTGDLYALVVLFDDEENPLGYYETSINVPLGQQVPEITSGVSVSSPEPLSYMVDIVREELPEALRSYSTYSTMLSYASFNVPENGLSPWLDNAARNDYSDGANSFGAGEARSWTVLVVLYDSQDNPLGYYESNVEITVGIQLPTITSGIRFENLSDYLGFSTVIERDNLPEFARGFSKISVQRMNSPFEIQQYGIQRWVSGGYKQTYTEPVSTTVESPSLWYALVILFDANENPIGYLETTVNVIPGIQVPAVTTGIGFENMAAYNGFYTSVTNNSLPEFIRDFSKITVNISGSPFNVTQAGIPGYILNGYKQPYSNPIFTGVDRPGTYSVLVVLYDANENPIGYTEANLTVTGATGLPQISAGISLENSSIYRGIEATVSRDQLPEFARQFSKITGTVSYAPFNVAQNGLPGWMENSYKKIYENNPYLVSVYGYQNYYVLIVLFDNQDNPIGYYETSFNAENQITLPVLEAGISLESSTDNTGLNIRVNRSLLPENAAGFSRIRAIESSDSYNVSQNGLPSWIEDGYTDEYHEPYYPFNTYGLGERNILVILFNNSNIPVGYFETKVNILEALPTPQNILLSSSDSSVHITWDNVEGATGYELLIGENTSVTVPTAEYTHSGLSPVTQYGYRIRAIDENNPGRFSDWSAVLYKYTILPVPSNITATAYEDSISLSWAAVEGALQYELVIDGGTVKIVHGNSYLHSGLEPNSEHSYKLRAIYTYNIELSGNWSEVVSKKTRLRTPSDIWAKTAIRSIELKWNPIEGATGYELTADGQKVTVTGTSYIHSGLEPDSLHTYRLKAIDDNGNQSEESAELKVKTKNATSEISSGISFESNPGYTGINTIVDKSQLPAFAQDFSKICLLVEKEPFNIDVNGLPEAIQYTKKEVYKAPYYFSGFDKPGNYDVLIVLFDINENPVGYMESEVNLTAGGLETPLLTTGVTFENSAANRGFNTIIDRNVLPEAVRNFSKIYVHSMKEPFKENVEQNGIPGFIRNMDKFTYAAPYFTTNVYEIGQYNVLLILVDAANNPIGYFEAQINVTGPAKLPVPQNIRASSTDRAVVLTWDAVAGADGYEVIADNIYYYVTGTEYVHMNLPANSFHNYQVRASVPMTPEKSSEWSQVISKLTLLQVPEGFYTTVTSNSVELYWNTVSGASYYEVLADGTLTTVYGTSYVHNNLQPDSMHVYQVKAKNFEGNESVFSYEIVTYTKKSIQPVTTGIKLENSANQNYFNTVITRSSLPEWARDFSKIRVITSKSPFNVAENGINPSYTSWSDWYYDPYYATYVNTLGNWYALVILFDYANNPIGYLESSINVALPQDDHGNDFNTATPVKAGQSIPGVITAGDVDFFAFTPTISGSYTMYTESSMDTYGYLYDSNQQLITYNDDSIGYNFSITAILQANKTYYIKVRHYDQSSGTGTYVFKVSNVAGGVQPLSVPTNLSYTASGTEINLKWDSVAGATEYEVLVDNLATEVVYEAKFVHSGLVSGSTHSYKVRAIDSANPDRTSQWSELLPAYIKLETPGNIIASPGLKQIGLTWNEVGGATGYEVLIDGITTEAVNEATFTHGNLSSGSTHSYKIRAISSENLNITSQWSDLLWVNTLLETPSNIVAKPGLDSITVTWDSVAGASNYELEADNKIFEVSKNNYSHMGLEPQTTHTYRVRAKNGNIYSEWSSVVNATTSLAIPMNITGVPTVSQITLSWDNIQLATGYEILVDGEQNEFVTTPSFIHVGLAANTTHTYKVRAIYENNQAIVSDWSQPLEVSTLLNAPENINTKVLSNSVELTWDSVDGATSYEVEADGSIVEVTSATYIHRDINPNSTHVYRVRAKKGSLLGEWSNKVTVTTTLSVPGNVTASSSVSTITVKWNAVAEATAYDLMADDVLVENITATSYVHMDLQGGTVHKYKVRARNGDVSGPWSNEVSATTLLSTVVSGSIKKDILWTAAESPYELQGNVTIEAGVILTIEPGVIVKTSSSSSRLTVQGKVSAAGLPDKPIIFTAPKDSLLGGNGSGFDWYGITVGSSGEFTGDYVKIRYAGGGRNYGNTGNAISTEGKLVLTNSEVSHTYGTGINIDTQGTKDITVENSDISYNSLYGIYISKYGTGAVSIKSNSMTNNGSLPIAVNLSGLGSSIFAGLRSNQFSDNKYNNSSFDGIGISGSVATNMSLSTNKYILTGSVTVPKGMTLTAEAGTVTLSGSSGYSLRVDGTLNAAGTESNPVVFTAPKDAEYGNGNGATYDWYGITVADTGEFTGDYVKIRYAGGGRSYGDKGNAIDTDGKLTLTNSEVSNTYGTGINIYIQGTQDVTVENCIIRDSLRNGIYISKYGTGSMSIKNNSLSNNANLPIAVYLDGLGSSIFGGISGNEFSGNKYNNLNFDGIGISGALKSDVTLSKNLYIITGYIGVTSGKILTMQPGVRILDSGSHNINVDGILRAIGTETDPIIFTAPKDEVYGNGNGATYDWYGITVTETGEFTGDHIKIRYAGGGRSYGDKGNAIDTDGKLTLTNSEISNTYGTGINMDTQGTQDVTVENCIIRDSLRSGIYINGFGTGELSIRDNCISNNANLPIALNLNRIGSSIFGGISNNEFTGNSYGSSSFDGIGLSGKLLVDVTLTENQYIIVGSISVPAGKIMTIEPGVRMLAIGEWNSSNQIHVEGILRAIGTEAKPVIFTAPKDEVYGNGNGQAYNWYGITVTETGEFTGDHIKIRYAGGGRSYQGRGRSIETSGKLVLTNSEVSHSYETGIYVDTTGLQNLVVESCSINDNPLYGIYINGFGAGILSIKDNLMSNNANLPIVMNLNRLGSSIFGGISNNEFTGNSYGGSSFDGIGLSGELPLDMTLTKNQYINVGSLVVPYGKTLTIQPGVRILAGGPQRSNGIHVEGVLNAIGTEADPIIFTAPKDEVYGNGNGQTFDWYGINIKSTGVFTGDNIKIRYAGGYRIYGYKAMSIEVNGKLVLTNSEVSYSGGTGIYLDTDIQPVLKTVTIEHNEFGMENANNQSMTVDAQYNYWGAVDGPSIRMYDEKLNRWYWVGTGDKVGDGINYYPYLGQELKYKFHFGGNGTNAPTGNYSRTFTDISISSPGFSLDFNRSYNSGDDRQNGPFGQGWTFGFESNIKDYDGIIPIKLVRLPDGSVQTFDVNSNGTFTARDNRNCLERKENGTFLLTTKDQNQFSFNSNGYLEYMKDKYGNTVSLEVDSDGKVRGLTDQTGRHFTVTYENGHITAIKDDVGGRTVRYEYENGLLTKAYDPMNNVTGYSYDAQGYLEEIRNSSNKVTESIEYINSEGENLHKVDKTTDVNGKTQTYTYDNVNRKTIITDNNGRQSVKWYDSSMFVTNQRDYEEKIETTEYDTGSDGVNKYGEEKALTDRNGNTTQFDRDERGNIKKITYPDLTTEEFEYDDRNNVIKEKDQQGRYTFYIFDTAKVFLLKKVQPLDGTSSYVEGTSDVSKFAITRYVYYTDSERQQLGYKAKGLVKTIEDPMGSITSYTYYSDGSIKELIEPTDSENPGTRKTVYSYNQDRLKNEEVSSKGYRTEYIYDKNGNLEKTIKYGEDGTTAESVARTTYDEEGRKKQDISPKLYNSDQDYMQNHAYSGNDGYRYTYYDNGKLHTVTDPENNTTTYTYDIYGNMASETKPNLSEYYYEYDVMNRLTKISFKENAQAEAIVLEEYSYTILGDKRTQKTEKRYIKDTETTSTIYTYDYAGRPVEQKNADGTLVYTEYYGDGKVKRTTDEDGYSTYYNYGKYDSSTNTSYDELYVPAEYVVRSVKYAYTRIDYDKSGRKIKEIKGVDTTALNEIPSKLVITDYTYYKNGRLKEQSDSNGRKTVYTYDADGNVKSEEVFTEEQNSIITAYKNNYLGKPEEKSITVRKGDIAGNDAEDNDTIELTTYLEYDKNGMLSTVRTPDGITTAYQYDKLDRTISVSKPGTDENGNSVNISQSTEYDTEGNVVSVTDGNGNTTQNTYDKRGLLLSVKNAEGGITAYYYDRAGRKVAEVAPKAFSADKSLEEMDRITYTYDVIDRVKTVTYTGEEKKYNPATHTWTSSQVEIVQKAYKYDNQGNVIKELDALGYQAGTGFSAEDKIDTGYGTEYTYNPAGKVTTIVDAESKQNYWRYKSQYTYDALGRVLTETNANRTVTGYSYDDAGNITKETVEWYFNGSEKIIKTSTYDLLGNEKTQTDGNGNTTRYLYNSFGKLHKTINPGDSTIPEYSVIHQYDVMGNLAVKKDSSGTVDTYSYDSYGRLLEHTQSKADGTESITTASRYDKNGNKRFETDGNGVTTEFTYDGLNRVKSQGIMVSGTEQLTAYDYDANGNQTAVTDWKGNSYTSSYDSLGRIIDKKDPYGISIEKYEYNNNNVQVKAYDALDNVTQYSYDRNNRLLSTTDPENHVTSQEYDSVGNISSKTDGSNNTTSYEYDEQNRLVKVTDASNGVTSYTYDLSGNMLTQTDGKGNQVIWEYNAANMVTRRIDDGGRTGAEGSCSYDSSKVESYTYNADGSLAAKTDRNGIVTSYTYDVHGRLTSNSVGGITIQYTYDKNGNQLTITDQTGKTTRTYDQLNRVITKEVPNIGKSIYTYDITAGIPEGNWAESTSDPKGNITVKTYDRAGRLKTVTADGKTTTYNYYDNGARQSVEYSDGSREAYTYYKDNLLHTLTNTKADGTVIDNYSYTYDAAHNETSKVDAKGTTAYTYDALNRLKTVTEPNGRTTTYTYDRAGNREREAIAEGSSTTVNYYRYNEQNRLLEVAAAVNGVNTGTTHYSYDNNGNMTSVTVNGTVTAVNTYDELNQLIKTVTGGKTVENRYNGEGLRVEKLVDGVITRYLYEYDKVVLELDGTGGQTGRNVYGTNLLMRTAGNETYIYMYNGHADVTALLRPDGTVAATYYYDAFGNITDTTGSASNSVTYAGYQYDSETGLYYLNARMYDPKTARFLQEDTYRGEANDPLSLNLYTYVNNNPVKYDDPTGHFANLLLGGLIGAVAGAVIDIGSQMIFEHKSFDEIDWKSVAVSTVDGGISGVLGAATGGISYIATAGKQTGKHIIKKAVNTMLVEAATASYANAMAQYAVKGEVDWGQVASTALISGVSGGLSSGLSSSKALNSFVDSAKEKTSKILSDISDSFPSRQLAGTNGLSFNASSINGLEDVTKTAVKKNAIQENYINVTKKLDNAISVVDDISPADALKNKMGNAGVIEANYTLFNKTHKGSLPVPKGTGPNGGRLQSHHGLQKEWSMENLKQYGYDPDLAPTITIETGKGFPHTSISNAQNLRRNARVASGNGKWSSTLQDELQYIVDDFTNAGYSRGTIEQVMEQQYKMLDKLGVNYERIGIK